MLPRIFSKEDSKTTVAVTIFLGANDSNKPENAKQHVPIEEYEKNLSKMVEELQVLYYDINLHHNY